MKNIPRATNRISHSRSQLLTQQLLSHTIAQPGPEPPVFVVKLLGIVVVLCRAPRCQSVMCASLSLAMLSTMSYLMSVSEWIGSTSLGQHVLYCIDWEVKDTLPHTCYTPSIHTRTVTCECLSPLILCCVIWANHCVCSDDQWCRKFPFDILEQERGIIPGLWCGQTCRSRNTKVSLV